MQHFFSTHSVDFTTNPLPSSVMQPDLFIVKIQEDKRPSLDSFTTRQHTDRIYIKI